MKGVVLALQPPHMLSHILYKHVNLDYFARHNTGLAITGVVVSPFSMMNIAAFIIL